MEKSESGEIEEVKHEMKDSLMGSDQLHLDMSHDLSMASQHAAK